MTSERESRIIKMLEALRPWAPAIGLLLFAVIITGLMIYLAGQETLDQRDVLLFQSLALLTGLYGSYLVGVRSAKSAAEEMVKPHAKSAFRRVLSLYQGLSRVAQAIEQEQDNSSETRDKSLDLIQAIVIEQIATADYALEDWRDLIPDAVEEVERRLKAGEPIGVEVDDE